MADRNRDSRIADDWLEVDSAASVVSLSSADEHDDGEDLVLSHPASPLLEPSRSRSRSRSLSEPGSSLYLDRDRYEPAQSPAPQPPQCPLATTVTVPVSVQQSTESIEPAKSAKPIEPTEPTEPTEPKEPVEPIKPSDEQTKQIEQIPPPSPPLYEEVPPASNEDSIVTAAPVPPDTSLENQIDPRDPSVYYNSLCVAIESIEATATKALELGASRISTLSFLKSTCDELSKHSKELKTILETYVKRWNDATAEIEEEDMPLNPGLLDWISHLRAQLLNAQYEMNRLRSSPSENNEPRRLRAKSIPLHINVALAGCAEVLEDALTTIEDFMPIFKTDFDEAQTRRMTIPTKDIGPAKARPHQELPNPDVAYIRRELYSLKDQLRKISAILSVLCFPIPPPALSEAPQVVIRLDELTEAVSTILTNHASEWLESDFPSSAKKTIAYHEFLALDPDVLHDVAGHLEAMHDDLVIDEADVNKAKYPAEIIRNHQIVLLSECGQMKELISTAEMLETFLMPGI